MASMSIRRLGIAITTACSLWSLYYVLFSRTRAGKRWYGRLAARTFRLPGWEEGAFNTDLINGAVPIITLAIPLLTAACVSVLTNVKRTESAKRIDERARRRNLSWFPTMTGDVNFDRVFFYFIFCPLVVYLIDQMYRHRHGDLLLQIANAFAFMALTAFSHLLVPVARHGPIAKLLDLDSAAVVRVHIWMGRVVMGGLLIHGGMHMYRMMIARGRSFLNIVSPADGCWTTMTTPECYSGYRNTAGMVAALGLIVIGLSSLGQVRRKYYRVFYITHVLATPLVMIMSIMHWSRAVLWFSPSLLYYLASSLPSIIESIVNLKTKGGVKILSVETIPSHDGNGDCISLTFEATKEAWQNYSPGQFVKLLAHEISYVSHPFTVNRISGKPGQMQIIFRVSGRFTSELAARLTTMSDNDMKASTPPLLHIDGFHGTSKRLEQAMSHDVVVMIAGGIGITPFLSLLHESLARSAASESHGDVYDVDKKFVLHWICRDDALIEYVKINYFAPLMQFNDQPSSCSKVTSPRMHIIVHKTGPIKESSYTIAPSSKEQSLVPLSPQMRLSAASNIKNDAPSEVVSAAPVEFGKGNARTNGGEPFSPSTLSPHKSTSVKKNLVPFGVFSLTVWLSLTILWKLFVSNVLKKFEELGRLWGIATVFGIPLLVSTLAVLLANSYHRKRDSSSNKNQQEDDIERAALLVSSGSSTDTEEDDVLLCDKEHDGMMSHNFIPHPDTRHDVCMSSNMTDSVPLVLYEEQQRITTTTSSSSSSTSTASAGGGAAGCHSKNQHGGRPTTCELLEQVLDHNNNSNSIATDGGSSTAAALFVSGPNYLCKALQVELEAKNVLHKTPLYHASFEI